jgi:predicted lipoprotein with Yx(FWY)xxD motif
MSSGASTSLTRFTSRSHLGRRSIWLAAAAGLALLTAACGNSTSTGTGSGGGSNPASASSSTSGTTVGMTSSSVGSVLTNSQGKTIYVLTSDHPGNSACTTVCLHYWTPVAAPTTVTFATGVTAKFGVATRSDGTHQLTVNGSPVYTYVGDQGSGQVTGQGLKDYGGVWWVLTPAGVWITGAAASSSSSPSATHSSSGGGGYGY